MQVQGLVDDCLMRDTDGRPCRCGGWSAVVGFWWAILDGRIPTDGRARAGAGRRLLDGGMLADGRAGAGTVDGCWVGGRRWMGGCRRTAAQV